MSKSKKVDNRLAVILMQLSSSFTPAFALSKNVTVKTVKQLITRVHSEPWIRLVCGLRLNVVANWTNASHHNAYISEKTQQNKREYVILVRHNHMQSYPDHTNVVM